MAICLRSDLRCQRSAAGFEDRSEGARSKEAAPFSVSKRHKAVTAAEVAEHACGGVCVIHRHQRLGLHPRFNGVDEDEVTVLTTLREIAQQIVAARCLLLCACRDPCRRDMSVRWPRAS